MTTDIFRDAKRTVRQALAADLGCDVADFDAHSLIVVPRAAGAPEPQWAVLSATFGTGTVLAVPPDLVGWVTEHAPAKHYHAMRPVFLSELAQQAADGQTALGVHGQSLGFVPSLVPEEPATPAGYRWHQADADWIAKYRATGDFDNSLGEPEPASEPAKAMTAMALVDAAGEPAAVAGIWDERHGRFEIGLDVRRADRGRGLAKPVVAAATRWIFEQGKTPIYTCGATNVRSHRTALSCGFLPLWTGAGLRREGPGPTPDS